MNIINENLKFTNILQKRKSSKYIVLHHLVAKTATVQDIHRWHLDKGWSGIGYNFYVRKDGKIYEGRGIDKVGAHTTSYNSTSLGIASEGDYQNIDNKMPDAQKKSLVELIKHIKTIYPDITIVGHGDLNATSCPGGDFPLDEIIKLVKQVDGGGDEEVSIEKRYNSIDELPVWAKATIEKLVKKGAITGDGKDLDLSYDMLRVFVANDRIGIYK